ncbi:hypothetical protein FOZ62_014397, partial [Perkinsus olseni]
VRSRKKGSTTEEEAKITTGVSEVREKQARRIVESVTSKRKPEPCKTVEDYTLEERQRRADALLKQFGLERVVRKKGEPQVCKVCGQYRGANNVVLGGKRHHVIGRVGFGGGSWWCPFADDVEILQDDIRKRAEKKKERKKRSCTSLAPHSGAKK